MVFDYYSPGDRQALHHYRVHFSADWRNRSAADALAACKAGQYAVERAALQPDLYPAWNHHDVLVRRAGDGRNGGLSRTVDARNTERSLSPAERVRLLDVPDGRTVSVCR